jgi:hypothetical protein
MRDNYYFPQLYWHLKNIWTRLGVLLVLAGLLLKTRQCGVPNTAALRQGHSVGANWFFHHWLLAAGGSYYLIGAAHLTHQPYNLHLFDPPAAALAGHAIVTVANRAKQYVGLYASPALIVTFVIAVAISGYRSLKDSFQSYSESGYKMGLALRQVSDPNDLVVTFPEFLGDPVAIYYSRRHGWEFPPAFAWGEITQDWEESIKGERAIRWLRVLQARGARWVGIVVHQKDRIWRLNPDLADYIQREFELREEHPEYLLYRVR